MKATKVIGLCFLLVSCGEAPEAPPPQAPQSQPLNVAAQEARLERCSSEFDRYRKAGLVKHGGARPGVDADVLNAMNEEEQQAFAETVACVGKAGQVGPVEVEVTEEGMSSTYRKYQTANSR